MAKKEKIEKITEKKSSYKVYKKIDGKRKYIQVEAENGMEALKK